MGVRAYTGLPGSGKTYRIVSDLLDLNKSRKKFYVIHNIPGLRHDKFKHLELRTITEICDTLGVNETEFFSKGFQERIAHDIQVKYKCQSVIVIDEAQTILKGKSPAPWLAYHRHFDQDIWLGTQNLRNLEREARDLVEFEIRGKKGPIFPCFIYVHRSEKAVVSYSYKFKNQKIYDAYKSFDVGAGKTGTKSAWLLVFAILLSVALAYTYYLNRSSWGFDKDGKITENQKAQTQQAHKSNPDKQSTPKPESTEKSIIPDSPKTRQLVEVMRASDAPLVWVGKVLDQYVFEDEEGMRTFDECFPGGAVLAVNALARIITVVTWDGQKRVIPAGYLVVRRIDENGQVTEHRIGDDWVWSTGRSGRIAQKRT